MARIPDNEIERLKSEVSVLRLAEGSGVELKRKGRDWHGRCPFHEDRTPSLVISEDKNLWHCLGACQAGGTVIDWTMRMQGVSFRHAVELLREGLSPLAAGQAVKASTVRRLPAPVSLDADDRALLRQVVGYYRDTLRQSPEALAYLQSRGLSHPDLIDHFQLGFANRTLGLRLPEKTRKAGAEMRERLQRLGLLRDSGHEHFNGSLVIPIFDESGNISEVYGRKITPKLRPGTPLHLYLPGPHRGVWNIEALQASKEIILCEALIDALTFWCAGYRNVTSTYGIEGFTDDHLKAFRQYGTERVLIAFDRDEAGDKAAVKLAERLMAAGIDVYRIQFPKGMDANEYALKLKPAAKSLGLVIRKAVWLGQGQAKTRPESEPPSSMPAAPAAPEPESFPSLAADVAAEVSAPDLPAPALPASPIPSAPVPEPTAEITDSEIVLSFENRRYRVRGLPKNLAYDTLKINLRVSCGEAFHVDSLDLYSARARAGFISQAAAELHVRDAVLKADLGRVLLKLEALQEQHIREALEVKPPAGVELSEAERAAALALLQSPDLLHRIVSDFDACGLIGERSNKLVAYLSAVSRKLDRPLAVLVQLQGYQQ